MYQLDCSSFCSRLSSPSCPMHSHLTELLLQHALFTSMALHYLLPLSGVLCPHECLPLLAPSHQSTFILNVTSFKRLFFLITQPTAATNAHASITPITILKFSAKHRLLKGIVLMYLFIYYFTLSLQNKM